MNRHQEYLAKRRQHIAARAQAMADYLTALVIGLALTALALAYFDIL
jgi:multisubunit Na+/H+ antiporter MnhC subunit